jgi:hypothetical protein
MAWHVAKQESLKPLARELGRAVVRGLLPLPTAVSFLEFKHPDRPVGIGMDTFWELYDAARKTELALAKQEGLVRWRVRPLCQQRKTGREIMAAARKVGGPMRDWEVADVCIEVIHDTHR